MATEGHSPGDSREDGEQPIRILSCNRLGLHANPPRAHFGAWLRRR